jgi:hypothetical protein
MTQNKLTALFTGLAFVPIIVFANFLFYSSMPFWQLVMLNVFVISFALIPTIAVFKGRGTLQHEKREKQVLVKFVFSPLLCGACFLILSILHMPGALIAVGCFAVLFSSNIYYYFR